MQGEESYCTMAPTRVILMSCGSYNPPTNMHLRMFEIARDHLHRMGSYIVVGAVISPTHDDYGKKELASADHRTAMLKLATQNSDWIRVSTWETRQNGWTKTRLSLQHHQNLLNSVLLNTNDTNHRVDTEDTEWIPENIKNSGDRTPIQIKLLCGADLLESFGTPGLWSDEDIDAIVGQHGLVVITREGSNPNKFIYDSDILSKYMHNIHIVTEWIPNEVSSTKIRRALKRGESVRYLVQDSVIDYVYKHGIYEAKTVSTIKLELSSKNGNDYLNIEPEYQNVFLTPSPSDVTMTTPSPVEIISIDISESVLKKNYQNSPNLSKTNFTNISSSDDTERVREKFINVISENGNKIVAASKVTYPGQAKQIIANESGESQIFCEVGLSCISENYRVEMEIDGKADSVGNNEDSLDSGCKVDIKELPETDRVAILNEVSTPESLEILRSSEQTLSPEDSESKESVVILSINVLNTPNDECNYECLEEDLPNSKINQQSLDDKSSNVIANIEEIEIKSDSFSNDLTSRCVRDNEANESVPVDERKVEEKIEQIVETGIIEEEAKDPKSESRDDETKQKGQGEQSPIINTTGTNEKSIILINEAEHSEHNSLSEESAPKRDGNIEIDGKYLKSVVNSRKSPKKVKNEENEDSVAEASVLDESKSTETRVDEKWKSEAELDKSSCLVTQSSKTEKISKSGKTTGRRRGVLFQGSLDSINVTQPKSSSAVNSHNHAQISKKSKSYEFIKPTEVQPTKIYKIPLTDQKDNPGSSCEDTSRIKSDSNSTFVTANDPQEGVQSDDFCSVCCYANDPSSTEAFYTLRSTGSSPLEEASTECDICSNCDLREDPEEATSDLKPVAGAPGEPVCELCEICGDVAMDEDVVASSRPEKDDFVDRRLLASRPLPLSLPKRKKGVVRLNARTFGNIDDDDDDDDEEDQFEIDSSGIRRKVTEGRDKLKILRTTSIEERSTDDTNSNDDEFEIENCGLDLDLDLDNTNENNSTYKTEVEDKLRNIVPRDEIAMSGKNSKKITRAGSLINRDTVDRTRAKRRYSSVDNLQNSRQTPKLIADKQNSLRSRGTTKGLVASADNIRPVRNSRSRSLRKSADDVGRGYHSSMDDTRESPLYENIGRKRLEGKTQHKPRDSGTIKMILTKHGIKIISDKETAL